MTDSELSLNRRHREEIIAALSDALRTRDLDALLVPHDDEYLSYELTPDCERLAFVTGFTGSAGFAVITRDDLKSDTPFDETHPLSVTGENGTPAEIKHPHAVFVDGRYTVQVTEQVDTELFDCFNVKNFDPCAFLSSILPRNATVGVDLRCLSYRQYLKMRDTLEIYDITLQGLNENPVDEIWEERPAPLRSEVIIYVDEYNGCPSLQKRQQLAATMRDKGIDATIITSPETVCWLLNIRGTDRKGLPVVNCKLVAYANEALEWYIDKEHLKADGIESELENHCGHLDIFPENRFEEVLERLTSSSSTVYIDPDTTNAWIMNYLHEGGADVMEGIGLCELPKAIKNEVEIENEVRAHLKDGVAQCRFLAWLDDLTALNGRTDEESYLRRVADVTEATLARKAESLRRVEGDFLMPSFDTISALGPNGAMCHYNYATVSEPRAMGQDALYLIDSGAHFIEGTTDITRTVQVGPNVTEEMRLAYTLVLKSHIALATTVFPRGTSGLQLDAIARRPLWDHGMDFAHGTGHGVGHLLSVHEGPQAISSRYSTVPLEPGMILSIEPGYYKEGEFGIRLENLVVVEPCTTPLFSHMLCFSPLTAVPFDRRLIMRDMLTAKEREWLNNFHQHVYNLIMGAGTTLSDMEINWLTEATAAL
ncbi:MAG TPA: aminopeptidase P family protein [Candidatus Avisuccinivibrio pullicola]|nr:aminopeptidase P family protein [Candidatus Avisuccinivibrio pullicola]